MLNKLWTGLLAGGVLCSLWRGNPESLSEAAFSAAASAVQLSISMCGLLALWMGLMKIAEAGGLVSKLGRLLTPLLRPLFPELEGDDPALSLIALNLSANLLGLGNASTPTGLSAMAELQKRNPQPQQASRSMITLLVMNTACITLLPTTVISLRSAAGSGDASGFVPAAIIASSVGFAAALLLDHLFAAWQRRREGRAVKK